ncbi:MAG: hypothetical protein F6K17_08505 [Okeania sp. SIO3C4]|nr:hypothetical protein [Okeania sp. SIO3C4]
MEKTINQNEAIRLLEAGEDISPFSVEFNDEKIDAIKVILLGKNGVEVPKELIHYDDDNIDFSDDPDITDEDFETGRLKWLNAEEIPLEQEIKDWLAAEQIDTQELAAKLIRDFYYTSKMLRNTAAL